MSHEHHHNHETMDHGDHNMDNGNHNMENVAATLFPVTDVLNNLTSIIPAENIGGHDHSGHNMHAGGHGSMMKMYFHFGYDEPTILFSFWYINTVGGLIGSMIGIFLLSMLYEGLKVFREYFLQRSLTNDESSLSRQGGSSSSSNGLRVPLAGEGDSVQDSQNVVVKSFLRPNPFSCPHAIQTALHMLQMIISYLLMLIFMTYNVWLCFAVVLGAGAGYFTFGWRKRTIIDINEHCH